MSRDLIIFPPFLTSLGGRVTNGGELPEIGQGVVQEQRLRSPPRFLIVAPLPRQGARIGRDRAARPSLRDGKLVPPTLENGAAVRGSNRTTSLIWKSAAVSGSTE